MVDVVRFMKLKQTAMTAKRLRAQGQRDIQNIYVYVFVYIAIFNSYLESVDIY